MGINKTLLATIISMMGFSDNFFMNLSTPVNAIIGDNQSRGTITSIQSGVISTQIQVSRLTGVAPLYVNFDMTGTTSSLTTLPTHELFYSTTFGDSGAGTWANGVQSSGLTDKNVGYGPVTGHVFETPGTYTVTTVVTDGVNTSTKTGTIVVQDPDVVYAGTATVCISHSGNFTGAPAGAQQVNTAGNADMYAAFTANAASNKRILFCKADSWTCSAQIGITSISNITMAGYGTGVARAFGSGTLVNVDATTVNQSVFATYTGCTDIRIGEFKVLGSKVTNGAGLNNSITQALLYKMEFRGCNAGVNAPPGQGSAAQFFDQFCMYECVVDQLYGEPFVDTPRVTATVNSGSGLFTSVSHGFTVGRIVRYITGGVTPPTPFALDTDYYIIAAGFTADVFQLSTTANGVAISASQTGSFTVPLKTINGGVGTFLGITRGGMIGCYIDTVNKGEQTVRFPFLDRAHINNNYFARPNQSKNVVKIHSFIYGLLPTYQPLYTEKFVFSGNVMDLRGGYNYNGTTVTEVGDPSIICGNGGSSGYERVRNGIFENNYTYGCRENNKASKFIHIACPTITVRNNIADFRLGVDGSAFTPSFAYAEAGFAYCGHSSQDPTVDVSLYNNTLYSNLNNSVNYFLWTREGTGDFIGQVIQRLKVKNNLVYTPFVNISWKNNFIYNPDAIVLDVSNNTIDQSVNPNFVNTPPIAISDWRTTTGYTIDGGTNVPVFRDFNMTSRVGSTYDIGALLP